MRTDREQLKKRAFTAYYKRFGKSALAPCHTVEFENEQKRRYVILRNADSILAVYQLKNDGRLKFVANHNFLAFRYSNQ